MKCTLAHILLVSLIYHFGYVSGQTYYVSPEGSDLNDGTSPVTAWQSLEKVGNSRFAAGSQILFERDGVFRGALTLRSWGSLIAPIVIGAYGEGEAPIISGSIVLNDWETYKPGVYVCDAAYPVHNLFVNGVWQSPARYPNNGFLTIDLIENDSVMHSNELKNAGDWLIGARMLMRTAETVYEKHRISNLVQGKFTLETHVNKVPQVGFGFFIDQKLEFLDKPGEWYYDEIAKRLYFSPPDGMNINDLLIEGSVFAVGVEIPFQHDFIEIKDLHFKHQTQWGLKTQHTKQLYIHDNYFSQISGRAIEGFQVSQTHISKNIFEELYGTGVVYIGDHANISENIFKRISLIPGYGETPFGNIGINANGNYSFIADNTMDIMGHIGIQLFGHDCEILRNTIRDNGQVLNNSPAIYIIEESIKPKISNNILERGYGNIDMLNENFEEYTSGIKLSSDITEGQVMHNTISNYSGAGLYILANTEVDVRNNTLFSNPIRLTDHEADGIETSGNIRLRKNKIVETEPNAYLMELDLIKSPKLRPPYLMADSNYWFHLFSDIIIWEEKKEESEIVKTPYTLKRWEKEHQERSSVSSFLALDEFVIRDQAGSNMFYNSDFNYTITDWIATPQEIQLSYDETSGMDGGSLKVFYPPENEVESQVGHENLNFVEGQFYCLRFKARSDSFRTIRLIIRQETYPWESIGLETVVPLSSEPKEYIYTFKASATTANGGLKFRNTPDDPLFWIDDIYLYPVEVEKIIPSEQAVLFSNDTDETKLIPLQDQSFWDLDQGIISGSISVPPKNSQVLIVREETFATSLPIPIDRTKKPKFDIFPNPASKDNQTFTLQIQDWQQNGAQFSIIDMHGKEIVSVPLQLREDINRISLDLEHLPLAKGVYFVVLQEKGFFISQKLILN